MTNNTDALPPALAEAITDNTPPAVRERYARLAELARTGDFGEYDHNVVVLDTETTGQS